MESQRSISSYSRVDSGNFNTVKPTKFVYFCGNAEKDIKKTSPTIVPYLTQSSANIKKVF